MAQLARRDIWIVDVEISELTKKTVSFKESKGGIILKNKKFSFDNPTVSEIVAQDIVSQDIQENTVNISSKNNIEHPHNVIKIDSGAQYPHNAIKDSGGQHRSLKPIMHMDFVPEPAHMAEIKRAALKLTVDRKYPILQKKPLAGGGENFLLIDDEGKERWVSDKYFVPSNIVLVGDAELNFSEKPSDRESGKLLWGNNESYQDMPNLRRK